jgi:serine/threonine protein phosphatase PrpC
MGNVVAFCGSADEVIRDHKDHGYDHGEDSAAVVVLAGESGESGDRYLLVVADGVGSSYRAQVAARAATESFVVNPSASLGENLTTAARTLQGITLPEVSDGSKTEIEAWTKTKEEVGSETMLNQILINSVTGKVESLFVGDGGFTVLRADGTRDHLTPSGTDNRLSTKAGLRGESKGLEKEVILQEGDRILLYSDALQSSGREKKMLIDRVCDGLVSGSDSSEIAEMLTVAPNQGHHDDDQTLVIYTHTVTGKESTPTEEPEPTPVPPELATPESAPTKVEVEEQPPMDEEAANRILGPFSIATAKQKVVAVTQYPDIADRFNYTDEDIRELRRGVQEIEELAQEVAALQPVEEPEVVEPEEEEKKKLRPGIVDHFVYEYTNTDGTKSWGMAWIDEDNVGHDEVVDKNGRWESN